MSASCLGDAGRVEVDGRATVRRLDALALRHLVEDRLRDDVARAERVGELLAVGVEQDGAVGARRLRDRVALHRLGPRAAVRVVLERVEVARLGAEAERDLRHLAGRARVVRRQLAALLGLAKAAAAGGQHDGARPRSRARRSWARQPAEVCSRSTSGDLGNVCALEPSTTLRSDFVMAWPVRSPTWSSRFRVAPPQRASR